MSIRRLPPELINRIAAGEVVERPVSALKNLWKTRSTPARRGIRSQLKRGRDRSDCCRRRRLRHEPDEMRLSRAPRHHQAGQRSTVQVTSFGFRGEALPSIASVSRLTLEGRVRGSDGWRIEIDHGEPAGEGPGGVAAREQQIGKPGCSTRCRRAGSSCAALAPNMQHARDAVKRLAMARSDVAFTPGA